MRGTGVSDEDGFYEGLPLVDSFGALTERARFASLPETWWIGVADIIDSTALIEAGQYKTVNMVGAAVISAMINALKGHAFPFVFGGDGAGFAVAPGEVEIARDVLPKVARWAETEFGILLRVALFSVSDVRAAGHDVRVARLKVSDGVDYAMFDGGGLNWAESRMKAGEGTLDPAPEGSLPDLTGLSCRWSHMPARNGTILTLLAAPLPGAQPEKVSRVYERIVTLTQQLERGGHPAPVSGPGADWPPRGARLEAHAARGQGSLSRAWAKALFESLIAWFLIRTGLRPGGFDARRYARVVGENADFRKLDDGLKMTLDCDPDTQAEIEAILSAAAEEGLMGYGVFTQDEAMMTCIVPSILTDDHVHFIDGAAGGYTQAARKMKASQAF
ncbi:DUF3095 domain-containing protein [Marimonas sp. MJW-29]|uniref:DUF3095 domain-containing protein n=1 Tax=Sulfitobacter sediminis TaxID=3234186 RepID=A0ABV3RLW1_9RHOB